MILLRRKRSPRCVDIPPDPNSGHTIQSMRFSGSTLYILGLAIRRISEKRGPAGITCLRDHHRLSESFRYFIAELQDPDIDRVGRFVVRIEVEAKNVAVRRVGSRVQCLRVAFQIDYRDRTRVFYVNGVVESLEEFLSKPVFVYPSETGAPSSRLVLCPPVRLVLDLPALDLTFPMTNKKSCMDRNSFEVESPVRIRFQPLREHSLIPARYNGHDIHASAGQRANQIVHGPKRIGLVE